MKRFGRKFAFIALFIAGTQVLMAQKLQDVQMTTIKKKPFISDTTSPLTALQTTVTGTFWRHPEWIKILALSAEQQKRMDDSFQQYRLKLIDLTASVEKEELILELLFGDTKPAPEEEARIVRQIDKIADARSELEKANSKMLISILQVLTADQWTKLPLNQKKRLPVFLKR